MWRFMKTEMLRDANCRMMVEQGYRLTVLKTELMQYWPPFWPPFSNCLGGGALKQKEHFSNSLVDHLSVSLHCDQSLGGDDELQQ